MQAQARTGIWHTTPLFANFLGILAALLVLSVLTNTATALIGDRTAFFALFVIGLAMCMAGGIGPSQAALGWTHPVTLIGSVFGGLALLLLGAVLSNWTGVLNPIASAFSSTSTDRAAVLALSALMAIKWAVGLAFVR